MQNNWTGERLEPFVFNDATIEHLHRYAIAKEFAQGKRVLDIACGEGYGSHLLAGSALFVNGVDNDQSTIDKALKKYSQKNISFSQGSVEKIPFEASTFDLVVCYETLEHVNEHGLMLKEIKRVLKPGGILLISTPDKKNYADIPGYKNSFHKKELYEAEFISLLKEYFTYHFLYYQNLHTASLLLNPGSNSLKIYEGDYQQINQLTTLVPLYFVAICSDGEFPLPSASVFISKGTLENALLEKEKAIKNSLSYKLGHLLLLPAKILRKLLPKQVNKL
jgi:2-polyprenyl-3-methyl-5-hydroxy-6-metoxy-1,4-benzoquinol methylase